jgi:hypothetical protein
MFNGGGSTALAVNPSYNFFGVAQGGTSVPFTNLPPCIIANKIMYAGI